MENKKYVYPDKLKLQNEYLKKFGEEFLILNNLNVGDKVILDFPYDRITRGDKYSFTELCEGILKVDESGMLYAESVEEMTFYFHTSNGRTGRQRKDWYEKKMRKSIIKFGTGFIIKQINI